MGQIINSDVNYLNDQAKLGLAINENTSYSRFLENAPAFVTYYRQNTIETTTDVGFGNVETNIGLSGKRYNSIKKVPLYGIDPSNFSLEVDELGIRGSYSSECIMIPDILNPIPEDFFTIDYQNNLYVFKITNVELDKIKSNNYYKLSFKYDREELIELENQVVDQYTCIFDNIGSAEKTILKDDNIYILQELMNVYSNICQLYIDNFFNPLCSSFILMENDLFFYDPYLIEFIKRNKLFSDDRSYKSLTFDHILDKSKDFPNRYLSSIFSGIEQETYIIENRNRCLVIQDIMTYFYKSGLSYYTQELFINNDAEGLYIYKYLNEFDYSYIGDDIVFNTILSYKNNDDTLNNYVIDNFKSFIFKYSRDYFICVPILLFIIKKLMNNITINKIN